jgi:hypothetical protein
MAEKALVRRLELLLKCAIKLRMHFLALESRDGLPGGWSLLKIGADLGFADLLSGASNVKKLRGKEAKLLCFR